MARTPPARTRSAPTAAAAMSGMLMNSAARSSPGTHSRNPGATVAHVKTAMGTRDTLETISRTVGRSDRGGR